MISGNVVGVLFVDLLRGESRANESKFNTAIYDLGLPSRKIAFQSGYDGFKLDVGRSLEPKSSSWSLHL